MGKSNGDNGQPDKSPHIPAWEWAAATFGLLLVAGAIGFMVHRGTRDDRTSAQLHATVDSIQQVGTTYLVHVRVENRGDEAAADVLVAGAVSQPSGAIETSELSLDYVPPHSTRWGGLLFTRDPRALQLDVRPVGYTQP